MNTKERKPYQRADGARRVGRESDLCLDSARSNENDRDHIEVDFEDHLNNSQTNALLNVQQDPLEQVLHQIYNSRYIQYFYIGLLITCCLLIITTIIDGFKIAESTTFIIIELFLNLTISADFAARVRMAGFSAYLRKSFWNKLDFLIVFSCLFLFIFSLLSQVTFNEISEELLLVAWSIAQSLRMLVIARKQKMAINSAKTLIDFNNVAFDPDHLDHPNERNAVEIEEVITFEDHSRGTIGNQRITEVEMRSTGSKHLQSSSKLSSMVDRQKALNLQKRKNRDNAADDHSPNSQFNETMTTDRYGL